MILEGSVQGEPPAVPDAGRTALLLVGSRVALLYLAGVVVAGLLTGPHGRPGAWAASAVSMTSAGAGVVAALTRSPQVRWALLLAVSTLVAMLSTAGLHPSFSSRDVQFLLGSIGSGVAAGTALSWGPVAGLAATAGVLACWVLPVRLLAPDVDGALFAGVLAGGLLGTTGSLFLRQSYLVTQRALTAAEEAVTARLVAAARWRARREEIRTLHDTVLSTLSLVSQGGSGVDEQALRADCRTQAAFLRAAVCPEEAAVHLGTPPDAAPSAGIPGASVRDGDHPFEILRRRWAARSLDVQVHGTAQALRLDGLAPVPTSALLGAVEECLENVRRHAGVRVVAVAVARSGGQVRCTVTDEGCGFEPGAGRADRIGLGDSVIGRVEDVGGAARVWSVPGCGTSVALSVPLAGPTEIGPTEIGPTGVDR